MKQEKNRFRVVEELYRTQYQRIFRFFMTKTSDSDTASELTQDTFTILLERGNLEQLDTTDQKKYLQKCARNKLVDYYKRTERKKRLFEYLKHSFLDTNCNQESEEYCFMQKEIHNILNHNINTLSPDEKDIFYRYFLEKESIRAICLASGLSRYKLERTLVLIACQIKENIAHYYTG